MSRVNKTKSGNHSWYVGNTKIAELDSATALGQLAGMQQIQDAAATKPSYSFSGVTPASTEQIATALTTNAPTSVGTAIIVAKKNTAVLTAATYYGGLFGRGTGGSISNFSWGIYLYGDAVRYASTDGSLSNGVNFPSITDTGWHAIAASWDSSGNVSSYLDGVKNGSATGMPIPQSLSTSYIVGGGLGSTYNFPGQISRAMAFNYQLSDEKIRRYSTGAKLDYEDIGGSMVDISANGALEGTYVSGVAPSWTKANVSDTFASETVNMYSGSSCQKITWVAGSDSSIYQSIAAPASGKRIRFSAMVRSNRVGTIFTLQLGPTKLTYTVLSANTWEKASFDVISIGTTNFEVGVQSGQTAGDIYLIDNISVIQLGAVLDLEPESATATTWHDESGNSLDGVVTGAQIANLAHFANTDYGPAAVKQELVDSSLSAGYTLLGNNSAVNVAATNALGIGLGDLTQIWCGKIKPSSTIRYMSNLSPGTGAFSLRQSGSANLLQIQQSSTLTTGLVLPSDIPFALCVVRNGAAQTLPLYLNGIYHSTGVQTTYAIPTPSDFTVGYPSGDNTVVGTCYRNMVFNYALSEDKIRRYSAGAKLDYEDIGGSMVNQAINGGASGTTDWANPTSGLAQSWAGLTANGKSIVTGNGFTGNAQRAEYVSAANDTVLIAPGYNGTGKVWKVSFKYRSNKSPIIFVQSRNIAITTLPPNTGNATSVSLTLVSDSTSSYYSFGFHISGGAVSGDYLEIDEVVIYQLGCILNLEPENVTDTVWADSSSNGLHGMVSGALAQRFTPSYSSRNYVINGGMDIFQRGDTNAMTDGDEYVADRFRVYENLATGAYSTVSYSSSVPSGTNLYRSLYIPITTQQASLAAGELANMVHYVEGYNIQNLLGRMVTLSFWVKSNKAGTYCFCAQNSAANRSYIAEYQIIYASTWEKKTITFYLDPTGSWDASNGRGLSLSWMLACGSSWVGTPGWNAVDKRATQNQVNFFDNVANTFQITGVQLNEGSVAAPFERAGGTIGGELALCQRYCFKESALIVGDASGAVITLGTAGEIDFVRTLPVPMRASPTVSMVGVRGTDWSIRDSSGGTNTTGTFVSGGRNTSAPEFYFSGGTFVAGTRYFIGFLTTSGGILFDAEL